MYDSNGAPVSGQIDGCPAIVPPEGGSGGGGGGVDAPPSAEHHHMHVGPPSNQLTLSFQGEVYVFDAVQPERWISGTICLPLHMELFGQELEEVQAVLLLLGGQELSSDVAGMALGDNGNQRLSNDLPRPCNNPQRLASIMRYREKRKNLCFDKKVLYEVRKDVAARMKRHKGQFASSKANSVEVLSPSSSCEPAQSNSQEEAVSSFCQNCGTGKDSTPMMRRGPAGPRSLCNACGLMWANKKTLRSHSQPATSGFQNSSINPPEQSDANTSDTGSNGHMFSAASNGAESMMIASIDASMANADG